MAEETTSTCSGSHSLLRGNTRTSSIDLSPLLRFPLSSIDSAGGISSRRLQSSLTGCSCWPPFSSRSAARSSDVLVVGVESASRAPAVPAAVALRSFPEWRQKKGLPARQAGLSSVATRSLSASSPVHAVPPAWRLGHWCSPDRSGPLPRT